MIPAISTTDTLIYLYRVGTVLKGFRSRSRGHWFGDLRVKLSWTEGCQQGVQGEDRDIGFDRLTPNSKYVVCQKLTLPLISLLCVIM